MSAVLLVPDKFKPYEIKLLLEGNKKRSKFGLLDVRLVKMFEEVRIVRVSGVWINAERPPPRFDKINYGSMV